MVTVYIYIESEEDAKLIVTELLQKKLIAHAAIDINNHSFMLINEQVKATVYNLITAQTKAVLFNKIVSYVHSHYSENIKIYSLPITQCNELFAQIVREKTN
jgi:uncharacterized protein involved in tolerance to divalent cations